MASRGSWTMRLFVEVQIGVMVGYFVVLANPAVASYAEETIEIYISPESDSVLKMEVHQEMFLASEQNKVFRHSDSYSERILFMECGDKNDWIRGPRFAKLPDSVLPVCFGIVSAYVLYLTCCIFLKGHEKEGMETSENAALEQLLVDHKLKDGKVPDQMRSLYDDDTPCPVTTFDKISLIVLQPEGPVHQVALPEKTPIHDELCVSVRVSEPDVLPGVHGERPATT